MGWERVERCFGVEPLAMPLSKSGADESMQKFVERQHVPPRPMLVGPLYHQISELIRDRIVSGEWSSSKTLPNEADLARSYQVSIGTIRKALELLGQANLIVRKQGLGTFVNFNSMDPNLRFSNWVERGIQQGEVTRRVLKAAVGAANDDVAERLGLRKQSPMFHLELLNSVGAQGVSINSYVIPMRLLEHFPDLLSGENADTAAILREVMARVARCIDLVDVATVHGNQAELLEVVDDAAVLKISRTGYDAEDATVFLCTRYTRLNGAHYSAVVQ
jgi:GntR family transcriptional regulator